MTWPRRQFMLGSAAAAASGALSLAGCQPVLSQSLDHVSGGFVGQHPERGHALRDATASGPVANPSPTAGAAPDTPRRVHTLIAGGGVAGLATAPYHAHVPSFGEWGFIIASRRPMRPIGPEAPWPAGLRFLSPTSLPLLFDFPPDMARLPASVNRLSNQVLVHTYETEWGRIK